jgi:hypothetical protein
VSVPLPEYRGAMRMGEKRRDENFGVRMKTTRVANLSAFHTNAPALSTSTVEIGFMIGRLFPGTDALPPLVLFLKKIRSHRAF